MQRGLLESAFHALKPGGVLVYSTCTLSLQENQAVCPVAAGEVRRCPER